ncbi:MAG: MFS transporter [Proteobacteria bacterium]|nr:MFS transporter [Pseudomonadota bacterium]
MWIDLSPLFKNRDFRYLYIGQFVSMFGTMLSLVALPFQIYELTESTFAVGLLGVVELVPLLCTAFIGGALADVMDRKKLLLWSELGMTLGCGVLLANSLMPEPNLWLIYIVSGLLSALSGLHRPSLDAMFPRLVAHDEIQAASVLASLRGTVSMIGGPAAAGLCISYFGLPWTFAIDLSTFIISIIAIALIKSMVPTEKQDRPSIKSVGEAIRYAVKRHELLGTYVVDFAAMVFAMPNALFPAIADSLGGTKYLGWLYSAPAVGALVVTVISAWTKNVKRHGRAVIIAATFWGLSMIAFGLAPNIWLMLLFLALAGAADGISGIFRLTIWNETIPDNIRGRMASLEMISYMSGPLLGNTYAGFIASMTSTQVAITTGGSLCVVGVFLSAILLPGFWKYYRH